MSQEAGQGQQHICFVTVRLTSPCPHCRRECDEVWDFQCGGCGMRAMRCPGCAEELLRVAREGAVPMGGVDGV
jgi:hypothetical protein